MVLSSLIQSPSSNQTRSCDMRRTRYVVHGDCVCAAYRNRIPHSANVSALVDTRVAHRRRTVATLPTSPMQPPNGPNSILHHRPDQAHHGKWQMTAPCSRTFLEQCLRSQPTLLMWPVPLIPVPPKPFTKTCLFAWYRGMLRKKMTKRES